MKGYTKNAKLNTKKLFSCDELLLNKKIKKDLFDSSKNNLLKSLSFSEIMVDMQSSKEKQWSPCISSIINNVPQLSKNVIIQMLYIILFINTVIVRDNTRNVCAWKKY